MADIKIREVTEDDFEDVMEIRKNEEILHGLDYLRDYFMLIYKTPGYRGYVAVVNGKIVSLEFACVLDDGETLFTRGGRVNKKYSGSEVFPALVEHVREIYTRDPSVKFSVFTTNDERFTANTIQNKLAEGGLQIVHQKAIYAYKESISSINTLLTQMNVPGYVRAVSKPDMSRIFENAHMRTKLFPDNRLVIDWVAYKPMKSNIPYIYTERCSVFGSNVDDVTYSGGKNPLITFASYVVLDSVIMYNFDIYGSDAEALYYHLIAHLKILKNIKLPHDILQLELFCYDNITREHCDNSVKRLGFKHFNLFRKRQYCFVKSLKEETSSKL